MDRSARRLGRWLAIVAAAATLAACASKPSPSAGPSSSSAAPTPATSMPIASPSSLPSPAGSTPSSPVASGSACSVVTQTGTLPSDRLVDLVISSTTTHDVLTFVFEPSQPSPAGTPRGTLEAAGPPFSFAGSGQTFELLGQHAIQLRFSGMTLADESGTATFHGPTHVRPALPALREAIQYDASEGIVGWDVGYDGPGCVTLARDGYDVIVTIAHPEAPAG